MRIHFCSIVLNGMPWIALHYQQMVRLPFAWEWHVSDGVCHPAHCTHCQTLPPSQSTDGTLEYLRMLASHDRRVRVYAKPAWKGKIESYNASLPVKEQVLLWQIDSDELFDTRQICIVRNLFLAEQAKPVDQRRNAARFFCDYYFGPDIRIISRGGFGNNSYEWNRVWLIEPGMKFSQHEPPRITGLTERFIEREETEAVGCTFVHMAYATRQQLELKQNYYDHKYANAVADWERLQANTEWPVALHKFIPWVEPGVMADRIPL